jgi:3-hydroxybutyryl-CoA dehydrogenase
MLVNEACEAVFMGVATAGDVELAMTKGVNYPKGLLAWGDAIGPARIRDTLLALQSELGAERYRPSAYLTRAVRDGRTLLA